jgi:hypothetical protein
MTWVRRGRIFDPGQHPKWAVSHAQVPTVMIRPDRLRIFYADRNEHGKSYITYFDVSRREPSEVLYYHKASLMPFGAPGTFDDEGMMPSFVLEHERRIHLYYSGWNQGVTVPYRNSVGLAVSDDDGDTFARMFEGPIMDRTAEEPYIAVTPSIIKEDGLWRMWYISGLRWVEISGRFEPIYVIKYAHSRDGISWIRPNHLCIEQRHDLEAYSHPTVIRTSNGYRMWFCSRDSRDYRDGSGSYRIGYAESEDGLHWVRNDERGGLDIASEGWDSTMTCYPYVIQVDGRTLLFYNGNGFGRTGIGYAVWEE